MLTKISDNKVVRKIKEFLSWRYFPFITALVVVGFYYLNLELASIYYIAVTGIFILLFLENITPLISNFLFMGIMISVGHSPIKFGVPEEQISDFLLQPAIYVQIFALIALYVATAAVRIGFTIKQKKFKLTPTFFGLAALSVIFLLNGVFSSNYNPMNIVYGLFMAGSFLGIFALMKDNVVCTEKTFTDIAYAFLALSAALVLELFVKYVSTENIIVNGSINRDVLSFGWGMYNNMGMMMLLCLPSIMFIAGKHKYGYLFFIYAVIHTVATLLTMSRQAMLGVVIIFPLCLVLLLVKGKNRKINIIITCVCAAALAVFVGVFHQKIGNMISGVIHNLDSGTERIKLWKAAWENFLSSPVFGTGFYVELENDPGFANMAIIPDMYHNTVFELLGACGFTGLIAYIVHRSQTIMSFCKNITLNRTYIAVTILSLLIVNLLDNHLFYILPTLTYSSLVAVLIKSQQKDNAPDGKLLKPEKEAATEQEN